VAIAQIENKPLELLNVNVKKRRSAATGTEAGREGPVGRRRTEPGARLHYRSKENSLAGFAAIERILR